MDLKNYIQTTQDFNIEKKVSNPEENIQTINLDKNTHNQTIFQNSSKDKNLTCVSLKKWESHFYHLINIGDLSKCEILLSKIPYPGLSSQKLLDLKYEIKIKKKIIKLSSFGLPKNSNLNIKIQKWFELLNLVTLKLDPAEAKAKLKLYTEEIILTAQQSQEEFDCIKLILELSTAPLEARRWAFRAFQNSNIDKNKAPLIIRIFNNWDQVKTNMNVQLQHFVHTALENMALSDLSIINGTQKWKMTAKDTPENTIITYIQPRYFALNSPLTKVPHQNSRDFFDTMLSVLSKNNINILPLVLPYTNLIPEDEQFRDFVKIGHHTYGLQQKTLHHKIAYLEEYSYLDESGFGPFSNIKSYKKQFDLIRSIDNCVATEFYDTLYRKYCQPKLSKFQQSNKKICLENGRHYYFFSMQTLNDTVARKAYVDQFTGIVCILKEFENTDKILLVKRHPLDNTEMTQVFLKKINYLPNCIVVDNNIHDLISASEATICVNSGVGVEALLHLKPVITLGESDYSLATTLLKSEYELALHMRSDPQTFNTNFTKKFLYFFFNYHVYKNDDGSRILSAIKKAIRS